MKPTQFQEEVIMYGMYNMYYIPLPVSCLATGLLELDSLMLTVLYYGLLSSYLLFTFYHTIYCFVAACIWICK